MSDVRFRMCLIYQFCVRDSSGNPRSEVLLSGLSEELERIARAAGNAQITYNNISLSHSYQNPHSIFSAQKTFNPTIPITFISFNLCNIPVANFGNTLIHP